MLMLNKQKCRLQACRLGFFIHPRFWLLKPSKTDSLYCISGACKFISVHNGIAHLNSSVIALKIRYMTMSAQACHKSRYLDLCLCYNVTMDYQQWGFTPFKEEFHFTWTISSFIDFIFNFLTILIGWEVDLDQSVPSTEFHHRLGRTWKLKQKHQK